MCVLFYSLLDMIGSKIRKCYCATLSLTLLTSVYVHEAHVIMTLHGIERYYFNSLGPRADISIMEFHKLMGIYMGDLILGAIL